MTSSPDDGDLYRSPKKVAVPQEVQEAVRTLIRRAGDDQVREGLLDTRARVARAWTEYAQGYAEDRAVRLRRPFEVVGGYEQSGELKDIERKSDGAGKWCIVQE